MYVWINLADIDNVRNSNDVICIPLLIVSDCPYLGTYCKVKLDEFDEVYLVYRVDSEERAKAIPEAYKLIGIRKMRRKVRTRLTVNAPGSAWKMIDD